MAAARLSGEPAAVTIFDVGEHDSRPFIVMELLRGGSLEERLRRDGAQPPARVLAWGTHDAGLGVVVASLTILGALLTTWPAAIGDAAARSRFSVPLMTAGAGLCGVEHRYFPGSDWLEKKFLAARKRAKSQSPQS